MNSKNLDILFKVFYYLLKEGDFMIAEVVVDIRNKQVNRFFDYKIPSNLENVLEIGMRVIIPFRGSKLQGFIVGIKESSEFPNLKYIERAIDITPVLTYELVKLAFDIAEDTSSFYITVLQAMLPSALKAKYKRKLILKDDTDLFLQSIFLGKDTIYYDKIDKDYFNDIRKAIKENKIEQVIEINDKLRKKYKKIIKANFTKDEYMTIYNSISVRAIKQKEILEILADNNFEMEKSDLISQANCNNQTLRILLMKNILIETEEEVYRDPYSLSEIDLDNKHSLNIHQQKSYDEIFNSYKNDDNDVFLLHGVTGSGKTEVYLQLIEQIIKEGKQAIVLVPEISLTPLMVKRFKSRFFDQVAVMHSALSVGERYDEWRKIRRQEVSVVVGARSAIFAPFKKIGIIIIDEEHETTYKQEDSPRYHALEVAKIRTRSYKCPLVLGSATPSLETYARSKKGVYKLLELPNRVNDIKMPEIKIVDMRDEFNNGNYTIISKDLRKKIEERLHRNEQIILLLNRRGYSNFILCRECGNTVECPNCDISLTYHKHTNSLKCHYCGYEALVDNACPTCGSEHLQKFGYGTQKVEEQLLDIFPFMKILRMDHDTTTRKGDHQKILDLFGNHQADVLLGTQMIAKGLDFPNVTLVGILSADTSLNLPDFRAGERTFQLITQVSGRAGRHKKSGEVVLQTYNPDHYSVITAANHDYQMFYDKEMNIRKIGKYSPYFFITQITITSEYMEETINEANKITNTLRKYLSKQVIILGPVIPYVSRISNRFRANIIVKYKIETNLDNILKEINQHYQDKKVYVIIDKYPQYIL